MLLNRLHRIVPLSIGQKLIVKRQITAVGKNEEQEENSSTIKKPFVEPLVTLHTVAQGETVFRIALNHNVSIEQIQKLNNLKGYTIIAGQKLKIPKK